MDSVFKVLLICSVLSRGPDLWIMDAIIQDIPMARAAPKNKTTSLSGSPLKKPIGRPLGSKNKVKAEPTRKLAPVPKPATAKKAVPAAPKMSKVELEAHVRKLERSLAVARKQVAALKLAVSDAYARGEQAANEEAALQPPAKVSKEKLAKQKPVATRGRGNKGKPEERALDEVSGKAETEAHAS
ncbi:MAG: hypothetical protein ACRYG8_00535 [Janthinobacterium lividum]